MNIAAADITAGTTFSTKYDTFTAVADAKVDRLNVNGGYKVEVTTADSEESFYHLFGLNDMVAA